MDLKIGNPQAHLTAALGGTLLARAGWALLAAGIVAWAVGAGFVALWCFALAAVALAGGLPLPLALVSPLYMGILGWLVDMLPFVILAGWTGFVLRWGLTLLRERRLPTVGRWMWIPIGLAAWTLVGASAIQLAQWKHFALVWGIQVLASAVVIAVPDQFRSLERVADIALALLVFVVVLSVGVLLDWVGIPVQELQDTSVKVRAESAYGVDAFPSDTGMIKYAKAQNAGALQLRNSLERTAERNPELPDHEVFPALRDAFGENKLIVRFEGSARRFESSLANLDVDLAFDNVGVAPANTVPRLRSFPRNALTYPGICAALLPFAFFFAWGKDRRKRTLGYVAVAACLFGAGFALARGAWAVILLGGIYLVVDGLISRRLKLEYFVAFVTGAVVVTAVFFVKYNEDPLTARAGGDASIATRQNVYSDTLSILDARYALTGLGMTRERPTESAYGIGKYIPPAGTHSTYLNYLFRTGVPGALAILALYVIATLHARAKSRLEAGNRRVLWSLCTASLIIVGVHGLILNLYVEPVYTLTISILVGLAMVGTTTLRTSVIPWRTRAAGRDPGATAT
ncbi:MAG: O-antigen ligase family protein [Actinomycetota bacterium]|nr:O-antigen ligase family protein [Actinomycetota bacterium]